MKIAVVFPESVAIKLMCFMLFLPLNSLCDHSAVLPPLRQFS